MRLSLPLLTTGALPELLMGIEPGRHAISPAFVLQAISKKRFWLKNIGPKFFLRWLVDKCDSPHPVHGFLDECRFRGYSVTYQPLFAAVVAGISCDKHSVTN